MRSSWANSEIAAGISFPRCARAGMLCLLLTAGLQAQSVDAQLDRQSMLLGDRVSLTVTVLHDPAGRIVWPQPEEGRFGPFEVLDEQLLDPASQDGRIASRKRWILTAFELGQLDLPPLKLEWIPAGRDDGEVLETPALSLTVEEVGADPQGELRDIKPPAEIPLDPWRVALWIALGLAAAALAWWLYRRWRRRPRPAPVRAPRRAQPPLPPHELAYRELAELEVSPLLQEGQIKEYYTRASEIIRRYLRGRYGIDAMEMTSRQISQQLQRLRLSLHNQRLFELFSERCDLVKFAKLRPSAENNSKIVPLARQIVDETKEEPNKPQPQPAAAMATASGEEGP
ncbi:MAG TPA: DUF4381 family protein [Acidobacteriota bacterium]|nr:DUF4381 family protein [Acidobacteriota bacterium]